MITCPKCGRQNRDNVKFCTECGTPLAKISNQPKLQQTTAAANTTHQSSKTPGSTILFQLLIVAVVCAFIPLLLGGILGKPVSLIKDALPQWDCIGILEGTPAMYLCSMKVGLLTMAPPLIIIFVIFLLRKVLNKGLTGLNNKLPSNAQFILPPLLATILFTICWAGYHANTLGDTGIVPNRVFPLFIGIYTYAVIQFGPAVQRSMASFFNKRDRIPVFFRYLLILIIPMGIALLITKQEYVTQQVLKEQFVVLVGLVLAYLLVAPRQKGLFGGTGEPMSGREFTTRTALMFLLLLSGYMVVRLLVEIFTPGIVLAGDCSSETDCQQTSGYNASTATGGAAIGGLSGAIGSQLGGATSGEDVTLLGAGVGESSDNDSTSAVNYDDINGLTGGPGDNPYTSFFGGNGPGQCPPGSIPMGLPNYWINTATLDLVIQDTIFAYQGLGPTVNLTLTYNANFRKNGMFGNGWSMSYESTIEQNQGNIVLWRGSGQARKYRAGHAVAVPGQNQPVEAISIDGGYNRLLDYGSYWLFVEKETRLMYRYDKLPGSGRLTAIYDRNGNALLVNYGNDGVISSITDAVGRVFAFTVDSMKHCTAFSLPDGRKAVFSYDSAGNLLESHDLNDIPSVYQYDADRFLSKMMIGNDKKTTTFMYQGQGIRKYVKTVIDAGGNSTNYEKLAGSSQNVRVIDPEGKVFVYSSRNGLTEQVIDPLGKAVTYSYAQGKRVSVQARDGHATRTQYDMHGNMVSRIDAMGSATAFRYDGYDNLLSETNPLGETWQYRYDDKGNLTAFISPTGRVFATEYNARGQAIAQIDGKGGRTNLSYDRFGNLETVTDPMGNTTKYLHDSSGLILTAITDGRGNTTRFEHDRNNRLTRVIHPDGSFNHRIYDCCSQVVIHDENGYESYLLRDPLLNIKEVTYKKGNVERFDYNRSGEVISYTDSLGHRFTVCYDGAGRPIRWTNNRNETVRLDRDSLGNLTSVTNERESQTLFERDANRHLTRITDPLGKNQYFNWNPIGSIASITNSRNNEISFSYDADGRTISKSYDKRTVASYEYDANSNLTKMSDSEGVTVYQYDADNRVILIHYQNGLELALNYDQAGNISDIKYPNGFIVRYTYDNRNRLSFASWGDHSIRYRYDPMNNILGEIRSNGTSSEYVYDADNMFTEITHRKQNDVFVNLRYKRDVIGNVTTESGISLLDSTIAEAPVKTTYNNSDQIEVSGTDRYTYDADGNLSMISSKWHAIYNAENRMIELNRNGQKTFYTYNGLGQRTGAANGQNQHKFYFDTWGRLLFETDKDNKLSAINIYAGGFLIARLNTLGETHFYHFDKTGNTLALTDKDGKIIAAYAYSAFGAVVNSSGLTENNPFTYVGQFGVIDEGEGLFFMKRRFYDATTGRFIQKDPAGFDGGINQYMYVDNNPVRGIDPEGTACLEAALIFAAFMAAGAYLACKFSGTNPWDKALNLPNTPPEGRVEAAAQISQEGKPYAGEIIMAPGDKALSIAPMTSPGYAAIKAAHAAGERDAVGVLRNAPCAPANNFGSAATAANEAYDTYQINKNPPR
jgi:RHS repeat-associated protein